MSSGRRTSIAIVVVVLVGVVAAALALGQGEDATSRSQRDDAPQASAPPPDPQTQRAAAATDALDALEQALADDDRAAFTDVYGGRAAGRLFDTLTALPLAEWDLRYIAEASHRAKAWVGDVEAEWSLKSYGERPVNTEVDVRFRGTVDGAARITSITSERTARTPEWLLGDTQVRTGRDLLVISTRPGITGRVVRQTRQAVRDVHQVLPKTDEPVVVVVPRDTRQLERLLGGERGSYAEIAAVTSTVDGTSDSGAPVRVALNPPVYRDLGPIGAQVVLSHEVTHAVTDAAITSVPLWLVEGFADYVALADEPVPVDVAASQILADVRKSGVPAHLPSEGDFSSTAGRLGASYEAAWLACQMIADEYGEDALVRFYRSALRSGDIDQAARQTLDTDTKQITRQWRSYLERLA